MTYDIAKGAQEVYITTKDVVYVARFWSFSREVPAYIFSFLVVTVTWVLDVRQQSPFRGFPNASRFRTLRKREVCSTKNSDSLSLS